MWLGDFPEDFATLTCMFTTHSSTGAPVAPLTAFENADVRIYKNGSGTEKTSQNGVTMTSPFDSITGLHCLTIDTSNDTGDAAFWVAGNLYTLVLVPDSETVDSITVTKVIGQFGIELYGALKPTTANRKLDVSAGGEAGVDWANVGSPTTALALTGTTIAVTQKVDVDTIKTNPVVNGGTITFPTTATLASTTNITAGTITTATTATNVTTVNGLAADVITAASIAANAIGASELAADAATEIANAIMDLADGVEVGLTMRNALKLIAASAAGKISGAATATNVIRNAVADSKDRISASVDASGNRSAITYDLT